MSAISPDLLLLSFSPRKEIGEQLREIRDLLREEIRGLFKGIMEEEGQPLEGEIKDPAPLPGQEGLVS
jgi:hypothetical protein